MTIEASEHRVRQWVTLRNSSMDVRVGTGISENVAHDLRSAVGRPHACALATTPDAPDELVATLQNRLTAEGFLVHAIPLADGPSARTLPAVEAFCLELADAHITSDDLVVAVGGADALSLASFACASWCGQTSLAQVPLTLPAALEAGTTPRALDLPGFSGSLAQDGSARFSIVDLTSIDLSDLSAEPVRMGLSLMVATAVSDSDKTFGRLWDRADKIMERDTDTLIDQVADTMKSRGKIVSSTSVAVRQSIGYGRTFASALARVSGGAVPQSACLADGMRFAARLSAALGNLSIDDMFAQDELLERLGIGTCEVEVEADALAEAFKEERFRRSNRLMVALPRALGRVRHPHGLAKNHTKEETTHDGRTGLRGARRAPEGAHGTARLRCRRSAQQPRPALAHRRRANL